MSEAEEPKNPRQKPRARVKGKPQVPHYVAKVFKKAAQIADLMTGEDVEADLKVLRDAKKAFHHVYDAKTKKLKKVPDHKTRLAATTLSRAYHEGRPLEKSMTLHTDAKDWPAMLAELAASSPAFQAIEAELWPQKPAEGKQSTLELAQPS